MSGHKPTAPDPYCRVCKGTGWVWGPIHFPGFPPREDWLPCSCVSVQEIGWRLFGGVLILALVIYVFCMVFG